MEFSKANNLKFTKSIAEIFKIFKDKINVLTKTTDKPARTEVVRLLNLLGLKVYR